MLMCILLMTLPVYTEDYTGLYSFCFPLYFSKGNIKILNAETGDFLLLKITIKNLHWNTILYALAIVVKKN